MHLVGGQKRIEDGYKDPDMLPKVNKADKEGMMEFIEEYLRSHHGVIKVPLVSVIRKTITIQVYGDYHKYATPDDKIIARIIHLPPEKNKLHNMQSA